MEKQSCVSPNVINNNKGDSLGFIRALATHKWEIQNQQKLQGLGLIVRFKCERCNLEWSNIVVEEEEKKSQILRQDMEEEEESAMNNKSRPSFEF